MKVKVSQTLLVLGVLVLVGLATATTERKDATSSSSSDKGSGSGNTHQTIEDAEKHMTEEERNHPLVKRLDQVHEKVERLKKRTTALKKRIAALKEKEIPEKQKAITSLVSPDSSKQTQFKQHFEIFEESSRRLWIVSKNKQHAEHVIKEGRREIPKLETQMSELFKDYIHGLNELRVLIGEKSKMWHFYRMAKKSERLAFHLQQQHDKLHAGGSVPAAEKVKELKEQIGNAQKEAKKYKDSAAEFVPEMTKHRSQVMEQFIPGEERTGNELLKRYVLQRYDYWLALRNNEFADLEIKRLKPVVTENRMHVESLFGDEVKGLEAVHELLMKSIELWHAERNLALMDSRISNANAQLQEVEIEVDKEFGTGLAHDVKVPPPLPEDPEKKKLREKLHRKRNTRPEAQFAGPNTDQDALAEIQASKIQPKVDVNA